MDEQQNNSPTNEETISEVKQLKRFTIGELVAGALLLLAVATHSFNTTARVSVLETQQTYQDKQLDRIEHKLDALLAREMAELEKARAIPR